jgi:CubicO group peptidase (beta-lactamase class C family)
MKPIPALAIAFALCLTPMTFPAPARAPVPARKAAPARAPATATQPHPLKDISALLAPVIQKHDVPGMAAAVVQSGETVALGVAGVRTRGKPDKIAPNDRFHLGSDTKAMTAMLCGILVDEGKLKWDQTLGQTFPELKKTMDPQYLPVTLEQLLHHRSGAPGDITQDEIWPKLWEHKGSPTSARRLLLQTITSKPPEATPGEKYIYSNAGYSIAGHMAEKVTGKSWEDLMREKIFRPLSMTTAGFGPPAPAPRTTNRAATSPMAPPSSRGSKPITLSPSAPPTPSTVPSETGPNSPPPTSPPPKRNWSNPETLEKLHTAPAPAPGDPKYAMGWIIAEGQPWAAGPALTHAGSNTMWMAVAWLAPGKDFAVLIATNQASAEACNDAALALIADHFKEER